MKYCKAFPCDCLADPGSAYCQAHKPGRAPKEADPFYVSVRWRRFRSWYIKQHPLCEQCLADGRTEPAAVVDHIHEIKDGGALTSDENAQSLCYKCHAVKSSQARNERKNHRGSKPDNRWVRTEDTYLGNNG